MSDQSEGAPIEQETSALVVAAVALRIIDTLNDMVLKGLGHDDASLGELFGATTYFTSVLDGKCDKPEELAGGFVAACQIIDKSLLDEIDRAQHFLADQVEKAKLAEGRALVAETHERWYLRLREGGTTLCAAYFHPALEDRVLDGLELDAEMEDIDGETEDVSDFQVPIQ